MISSRVQLHQHREVFKFRRKNENTVRSYTWQQFWTQSQDVAKSLLSHGCRVAENIGILSDNRPEWTIADIGILSTRGVVVPLYPSNTKQQIKFIVDETRMQIMFVGNIDQLEKAFWALNHCQELHLLVVFDVAQLPDDPRIISFEKFIENSDTSQLLAQLKIRLVEAETTDVATIIYTSGTMGEPKGAMLTHENFMESFKIHDARIDIGEKDLSMCYLPLSHVFERAWTYYILYRGATNYYLENPRKINEMLHKVKPTVMCVVPRFFEKIYEGIQIETSKWSILRRKIFNWAIKSGKEYLEFKNKSQQIPQILKIKRSVANLLVLKKLRSVFGGHIRFIPCAGSAINVELLKFFHSTGLFVIFGYGATETTASVSCFETKNFDINTCGKILPEVEVKISEAGEILVKSKTVFKGYYKKPDVTKKVFEDNWFKTGDKGYLTENNELVMIDRIDDLFKTSGAIFVSPQRIELMLSQDIYIQQVVVIGDRHNYVTALIVPSFENLRMYAKKEGINHLSNKQLIELPQILMFMHDQLEQIQEEFASHEKVLKFTLLPEPFSVEQNTLTPSLKIRRKKIMEKYKTEIAKMYEEN